MTLAVLHLDGLISGSETQASQECDSIQHALAARFESLRTSEYVAAYLPD